MYEWVSNRYRLILVVGLLLVAAFTATSLIYFHTSRDAIRTSILENELPLSSNTIYSEIQKDLLRPIFISSLMAHDTFLRDWVLAGEKSPEQTIRYLREIRDKYKATTSYFISDRSLNYYHFSGISRKIDLDDPADQWFLQAKQATEPYKVNLDINKEQGNSLTVFINYRVLDYQGGFLGVTGIGLALESISRLILEYQQNFRRSIYFVDKQGRVRLHSDQTMANNANLHQLPGINLLADEILSQERGSYKYQRNGETILLTTRYIPELGWQLLVELDESKATATLQRGLLISLVIGTAVTLLTILLITLTINAFHKRLEELASTDALSGLGNRPLFDHMTKKYLLLSQRNDSPLSLILFDIDHFKGINDRFGHKTGDEVIKAVAQVCSAALRGSDLLCRWGGDEFSLLLSDCGLEDARQRAETLRQNVYADVGLPALEGNKISISIGVTEAVKSDSTEKLFNRADKALYQSKAEGRNRVSVVEG